MCFFMKYGSQKSHYRASVEEFIEEKKKFDSALNEPLER